MVKPQATETFEIRSRWTNATVFAAEITSEPGATIDVKLGLSIRRAVKVGANLAGAYLAGADLRGADLAGANFAGAYLADANLAHANLTGADLTGANLSGAYIADANLSGAELADVYLADANLESANFSDAKLGEETLRPFKADLFLTLSTLGIGPLNALHLISKLSAGAIDGRTYGQSDTLECACLVGTVAQSYATSLDSLDHNIARPAERWFLMIKPGDKPGAVGQNGKETGGGYAARKALEWVRDWCICQGITSDDNDIVKGHSI